MSKKERDDEFWELTDKFINLANEQCDKYRNGQVSTSMLFSAARFNAFMFASSSKSKEEFVKEREMAIEYFTNQYRKVLTENINDYEKNFTDYIKNEQS